MIMFEKADRKKKGVIYLSKSLLEILSMEYSRLEHFLLNFCE